MKFLLFALGVLTGTVGTYLVLTRVWWPDVRLQAAHQIPAVVAVAVPSTTPAPMPLASPILSPQAFGTPAFATPETPIGVPPESWPKPPVAQLTPSPIPVDPVAAINPPIESKTLDLPLLQTDLDRLRVRGLIVPVKDMPKQALRNTFNDDRGGRVHQAMDIMAARGTPVLAVEEGRVEKLFTSKQGGLTLYQFDPSGEYCYYYAHLDSYAKDIEQGRLLRKGDVIGYVGSTGNASPTAPHLHFTIFRLGAEKRWWEGTAINPFPLWAPSPAS